MWICSFSAVSRVWGHGSLYSWVLVWSLGCRVSGVRFRVEGLGGWGIQQCS